MESKNKTVLIVEDEKNIVDILRFNLQREGYQTCEAYDGADGLEKARTMNPDIILLDVLLPKMIGFDVCKQLRSEGNEEYNKAVAAADLEARQIEAAAISEAGKIRGEADAEAAGIYSDSYAADPEFYAYWRALQALEKAIGEDTTLVLDQTNPLFADIMKFITD